MTAKETRPNPHKIQGSGIVVGCKSCTRSLNLNGKIQEFVSGKTVRCHACNAPVDWWDTVLSNIQNENMHPRAIYFLGARTLSFEVPLKVGEGTVVQFSKYGIPANARKLFTQYHPAPISGKGYFTTEYRGGINSQRYTSDEITLYTVPFGHNQIDGEPKARVTVGWVPHAADNESWLNLIEAAEFYVDRDYTSMIFPANVAVESALGRLLKSNLIRYVSKERTKDFLTGAATYSSQLNILLPVIASLKSLPLLPPDIRGELNRLRDFRNELAHSGVLKKPLDRKSAANLFCGALFGFHYMQYVHSELEKV